MIDSTIDLVSSRAHTKGIEVASFISPEVPTMLQGDPGRLRQVMINLLSNAVKFTESGGVSLTVELADAGPDEVKLHFSVRDTGIGVPEQARAKLFSPFSQVDAVDDRGASAERAWGSPSASRFVDLMQGEDRRRFPHRRRQRQHLLVLRALRPSAATRPTTPMPSSATSCAAAPC